MDSTSYILTRAYPQMNSSFLQGCSQGGKQIHILKNAVTVFSFAQYQHNQVTPILQAQLW